MTNAERRQLDEQGFVLLEHAMDGDLLRELRERIRDLFDSERDCAGLEFRIEAQARAWPTWWKGAEYFAARSCCRASSRAFVTCSGQVKLSSLNARSADPHGDVPQPLPVDMSAIPDERGYRVCNTVWMLDDFTPEIAPTRVDSRVARDGGYRPQADRGSDEGHIRTKSYPRIPLSSIAVMNARTWHRGHGRSATAPRLAIHSSSAAATSRSNFTRSSCCGRRCGHTVPRTVARCSHSTIHLERRDGANVSTQKSIHAGAGAGNELNPCFD